VHRPTDDHRGRVATVLLFLKWNDVLLRWSSSREAAMRHLVLAVFTVIALPLFGFASV